jgi:uncharacterized protein YndB with AHSA1/START domain
LRIIGSRRSLICNQPLQEDGMTTTDELGSIERTIRIAATPEVVYAVVSTPEHIGAWWSDDADLDGPGAGARGSLVFGERGSAEAVVEGFEVVEVDPPRSFTFRWGHPAGSAATAATSYLVTFALEADGAGTLLRMTETGFRERGWEVAVLEQAYADHVAGWAHFLPRLVAHAELVAR